jgi:hypothetical protein
MLFGTILPRLLVPDYSFMMPSLGLRRHVLRAFFVFPFYSIQVLCFPLFRWFYFLSFHFYIIIPLIFLFTVHSRFSRSQILSNLSKYVEKYHHIKYSITITRITIKNIFIFYEFGMYCLSFLSNKASIIEKNMNLVSWMLMFLLRIWSNYINFDFNYIQNIG